MKICAIIFQHGKNDHELWSGFSLSKEDENKIMDILEKYNTDGCSARGMIQVTVDGN